MNALGTKILWNGGLVVPEIVVEGVLQILVRRLQLYEEQRNAIQEPDEVAAATIHVAGDPKLRGEKKIIVLGVAPVDDAHGILDLIPVIVPIRDFHPVAKKLVEFVIGIDRREKGSVAEDFCDGVLDRFDRKIRVESL
jgi:hypothetical protein